MSSSLSLTRFIALFALLALDSFIKDMVALRIPDVVASMELPAEFIFQFFWSVCEDWDFTTPDMNMDSQVLPFPQRSEIDLIVLPCFLLLNDPYVIPRAGR